MDRLRWTVVAIGIAIVAVVAFALISIVMPGSKPAQEADAANGYDGSIQASTLLRVPVTGIYPGGNPNGLYTNLKNPLADDPDAVTRGMKDFNVFNCSGCHMANGGGGMGPALSDDKWVYRSSPANIYLDIVQGRGAGMPAFGAMLPDRTVWELVAYIQSISRKPAPGFGTTTSANPQSPDTEQVPVNQIESPTPWQFTEPMPPNGEKPGSPPQ